MITLGVAAILAVIAVPSFRTYVLNARRDSQVNGLVASLHYARSEALSLDQTVYLCAGTAGVEGTGCASGTWPEGWDVITDTADSATAKLLVSHSLSGASTQPSITAVNGSTYFEFTGNGLVQMNNAIGSELVVFCDSRGASEARAVEISASGYIQSSSQNGLAPDGVTALTCP